MTYTSILYIIGVVFFTLAVYNGYKAYRETEKEKRPKVITIYLVSLIAGIAIVFAAQYFGLSEKLFHFKVIG